MNLLVLLGIVAVFVVLRLMKVGLATWIVSWWLALYVACEYGFITPINSGCNTGCTCHATCGTCDNSCGGTCEGLSCPILCAEF